MRGKDRKVALALARLFNTVEKPVQRRDGRCDLLRQVLFGKWSQILRLPFGKHRSKAAQRVETAPHAQPDHERQNRQHQQGRQYEARHNILYQLFTNAQAVANHDAQAELGIFDREHTPAIARNLRIGKTVRDTGESHAGRTFGTSHQLAVECPYLAEQLPVIERKIRHRLQRQLPAVAFRANLHTMLGQKRIDHARSLHQARIEHFLKL